MSDYFGSAEHIESVSHEKLKELALYFVRSRDDLQTIIMQQDAEITELHRKIANQRIQLRDMQMALERRNQGDLKARWQRELDALKAELDRCYELLHDLQNADGWPDDDKLIRYGIDPSKLEV